MSLIIVFGFYYNLLLDIIIHQMFMFMVPLFDIYI